MFTDDAFPEEDLNRFSRRGALPDTIVSGLYQYKIRSITNLSKWKQVIRGNTALPTCRSDMAIPVRCEKKDQRRLEPTPNGDVELDLMICTRPYPRVVLQTGKLNRGQREILERIHRLKPVPIGYG